MPTSVRSILILLSLLLCAGTALAQSGDRYADWRKSQPDDAALTSDEPYMAAEPPAVEPMVEESTPDVATEIEDAPPVANDREAWQSPPRALRRLPFRFEPAPPGYKPSKVILASASEPVERPLERPEDPRPKKIKPPMEASASKRSRSGMPSAATLMGSVATVAGLFVIVAWAARRGLPRQPPTLPREALEILGRQRFAGKQEMQLVRVGNKLLLIHVMPGHVEALCEVTDAEEVDRLTGICYQAHPHSSSRGFHQTLEQFAQEKPASRRPMPPVVDKLDLSVFDSIGRSSVKSA